MRPSPAYWFGALRRRQRAILCALLPALALSAASGPACAAMPQDLASDATVESHDSHDAHAAHHDSVAPDPEPSAPATQCPHCPLDSGAANVDHARCVTVDAQEDGGATPPNAPGVPAPLFLTNWLLPAACASPPLIAIAQKNVPLARAVPLNLRYCVLLI